MVEEKSVNFAFVIAQTCCQHAPCYDILEKNGFTMLTESMQDAPSGDKPPSMVVYGMGQSVLRSEHKEKIFYSLWKRKNLNENLSIEAKYIDDDTKTAWTEFKVKNFLNTSIP